MSALDNTSKKVIILSAVHDFRMRRRGSIQSLAAALIRNDHEVTFVSTRFSLLALLKRDSRTFLWKRVNRPEYVGGVRCYLWFTLIHPFNSSSAILNALMVPCYALHKRRRNRFVDGCLKEADYIIIESGQAVLFAERARRLNPAARIVYRASDKLSTIGAGDALQAELERSSHVFDWFCLLSAGISDELSWVRDRCYLLPQGIDEEEFADPGPNPYTAKMNAVSVGSMLFDSGFFATAASQFPEIQFHVIGAGTTFAAPPNVHIYGEMPFRETLRYIKFANLGIAPYRATAGAEYLGTSSLKLKQYEYFGIPAICPNFAVGPSANRFGYDPNDSDSIVDAIERAGRWSFVPAGRSLTWQDLANRLLDPSRFEDCKLIRPVGAIVVDEKAAPSLTSAGGVIISLITCTVGERRPQLARLLKSLRSQSVSRFELIVVDQNPSGVSCGLSVEPDANIKVIGVGPVGGLSAARNLGLRYARGSLVGFPDDDCWYLPETLKQVVEFFDSNSNIGILLGRTIDEAGRSSLSPARARSGTVDSSNVWTSGNSNTLFARRSAIPTDVFFDEKIGVGASTRFQSGEETDFVLALIKQGVKATYLADLKVYHDQVGERGLVADVSRSWRYSQGFGYVLWKHKYGVRYLLYRVGRSLGGAVLAFGRLKAGSGVSRLAWTVGTCLGYIAAAARE